MNTVAQQIVDSLICPTSDLMWFAFSSTFFTPLMLIAIFSRLARLQHRVLLCIGLFISPLVTSVTGYSILLRETYEAAPKVPNETRPEAIAAGMYVAQSNLYMGAASLVIIGFTLLPFLVVRAIRISSQRHNTPPQTIIPHRTVIMTLFILWLAFSTINALISGINHLMQGNVYRFVPYGVTTLVLGFFTIQFLYLQEAFLPKWISSLFKPK